MQKIMTQLFAGCLLLMVFAGQGMAEDDGLLGIGDTAPGLDTVEWFTQDLAAQEQQPAPVYSVYDCWATWCGPCRQSIPELNELYRVYRPQGVEFIGIAVWDEREKVKEFLANSGQEIAYPIGFDAGEKLAVDLMQASGQSGIPVTFVVRTADREILWIGHPMALGSVLKQLIDGSFDASHFKQLAELENRLQVAIAAEDLDAMGALADEWLVIDPPQGRELHLWVTMLQGDEAGSLAAVEAMLDAGIAKERVENSAGLFMMLQETFPENPACAQLARRAMEHLLEQEPDSSMVSGLYWYMLVSAEDESEALSYAENMVQNHRDDPLILSDLVQVFMGDNVGNDYLVLANKALDRCEELTGATSATRILRLKLLALEGQLEQVNEVAAQLINTPDIDFSIFNEVAWNMMQDDRLLESGATAALMLAEKANALTEASDASVLDTLALARFRGGDVQGAIEAEEQAIALAPDVDELQMQLGLFKEALRDEQAADYMKNENTGSDQ